MPFASLRFLLFRSNCVLSFFLRLPPFFCMCADGDSVARRLERKERRTDAYECLQYFLQQNRAHFRVERLRRSNTRQLLYSTRVHRSLVTKLDVSNRQVLQRHVHVEVIKDRYRHTVPTVSLICFVLKAR